MNKHLTLDLQVFCPEWGVEGISERFCDGCEHLNGHGVCDYSYEEKLAIYEVTQRLKIGL